MSGTTRAGPPREDGVGGGEQQPEHQHQHRRDRPPCAAAGAQDRDVREAVTDRPSHGSPRSAASGTAQPGDQQRRQRAALGQRRDRDGAAPPAGTARRSTARRGRTTVATSRAHERRRRPGGTACAAGGPRTPRRRRRPISTRKLPMPGSRNGSTSAASSPTTSARRDVPGRAGRDCSGQNAAEQRRRGTAAAGRRRGGGRECGGVLMRWSLRESGGADAAALVRAGRSRRPRCGRRAAGPPSGRWPGRGRCRRPSAPPVVNRSNTARPVGRGDAGPSSVTSRTVPVAGPRAATTVTVPPAGLCRAALSSRLATSWCSRARSAVHA